jgi:hypothetical protein
MGEEPREGKKNTTSGGSTKGKEKLKKNDFE